ncbi:FISUMP domain-containing protein [Persicobacter diffluens]|uniref:Fibrobacter succinogenes major paralogous domain-containing protein n=1 Tax=Persicobacter diffluens TaxID=981 RepID=A0AAN4W2Q9_9BACT|nr:hypothetical protein PEDI_45790 [Persicobacter diffluens]
MKLHELKPFAAGLMAAAMMFSSCGSDDEPVNPTPPPVDEEKVVPTLAVAIPEHMRSGDFDQELTHVYLYADSARLEFSWVLEDETNYYEVGDELSLTIGDQEYTLNEVDGKFTTDLLMAEFNDQYLEDITASASVEITDASYEEEGDAVVPLDFTITTGKFGSVVFDFQTDYRYSTVQICDAAGENCQVWMAENLRWEGKDGSIGRRLYNLMGETEAIPNYVEQFGHMYSFDEKAELLPLLSSSDWTLPTFDNWGSLFINVGGSEDNGVYSNIFNALCEGGTWDDSIYQDQDDWENQYLFSVRGGGIYREQDNGINAFGVHSWFHYNYENSNSDYIIRFSDYETEFVYTLSSGRNFIRLVK